MPDSGVLLDGMVQDPEPEVIEERGGRFQCPYCNSFDVSRLFIASVRADSCQCLSCGARWDQEAGSGEFRDSDGGDSVMLRPTGPGRR